MSCEQKTNESTPFEKMVVSFAASYSLGDHPGGGPKLFQGAIITNPESFKSEAISDSTGEKVEVEILKETIGEVKRVKGGDSYLINWEGELPATWCFEQVRAAIPIVGSHVRSIKVFCHGQPKTADMVVHPGWIGLVMEVDKDGDYLIKWYVVYVCYCCC